MLVGEAFSFLVTMSISKYSDFHILWDIDPRANVLTQDCNINEGFGTFSRIAHVQQHSLTSKNLVLETHRVIIHSVLERNEASDPFSIGSFSSSSWRCK